MLKQLLLIGLIVIVISIAVSAQEGVTYIEGQITVLHLDPAPGSGGQYQVITSLYDDNGQRTELDLPAGMDAQNLGRVRVHGAFMPTPQTGTPVFSVHSIEELTSPLESPSSTGTLQYVTVLCRFSDSTGAPPHPFSYFDGLMGNTSPGVQHFWNQVSLGQLNVISTTTGQWFTMSNPMSVYDMKGNDNHDQMAQDCIDAADPSFDFSPYDGLNMIFDRSYTNYALGGTGMFTIEGARKFIRITWNPPFSYNNVSVIAHEVGHTLGLPHSAGNPAVSRYPYDSHWDVMSGGGDNRRVVDPNYGKVGPNTITYHMDRLNWIDSRRVTVSTGQAQTVTLERLNQPISSTNPLMAKIPINNSTTNFYTVEARFENSGYDAAAPGTGVIIHRVDTSQREHARVVDNDGNTDVNDAGAIWLPGETFTDSATGISVQVISQGTSSFQVCVSNNGGACGSNPNPTPTPTTPPNTGTVANDDNYTTPTNTTLTISASQGVMANDTGNKYGAYLVQTTSSGTLTLDVDGSFTYTPNTSFVGSDSFTYQVHDGSTMSNTATVTITVNDTSTGITPQPAPQLLEVLGSLDTIPVKPSFRWQHMTQAGQTAVPGTYYRLIVVQDQTLVYDDWFEASSICSGLVCTLSYPETTPGAFGKTMPAWGLVKGGHSFYVQSYIDGNTPLELSVEKQFTVNLPGPALPSGFAVDNNASPAQFVWTDDTNALYYRLYISDGVNDPLFFDWVEKTTSLCNGSTCRFTPSTAVQPGVYLFYVQPWGPGGFAPGGIENLGWDGAKVTVGPGLATNLSSSLAGSTATLTFTAASDADSYRLWVGTVKGVDITEAYFQTHTAADLGCTTVGSTCTFTLDISSFAPDTYNWYVQASGPIGISAAGTLSGWAEGSPFIVN